MNKILFLVGICAIIGQIIILFQRHKNPFSYIDKWIVDTMIVVSVALLLLLIWGLFVV